MLSTPCNTGRSKRLLSVELSNYKKLEMRDNSKPEETQKDQVNRFFICIPIIFKYALKP